MFRQLTATLVFACCLTGAQAQLLIGQTAGYTGIVGPGVKETADGAKLYIDAVNAKGGVLGQKIELISMDDKFEPKLAAENARVLIEEKNVLALFMGRGTPPTEAVIPVIDKFGVPYIAPSTGAISMHAPVQRHIFNVRAPYQAEGILAVKHLSTIGLTKIAVIHVDDSFGKDGLAGVLKGFEEVKSKALYVDKYDRTKPDFAVIAPRAAKDQPQAIIFIGSGGALAQGVKALRAAGSSAQILTLSNNAAGAFIKQLGADGRGVIVTQVFPGERNVGHPFINEASVLARAKGIDEMTPSMLEGFAGAKVLVEALRRAGPNPTREKLLRVLENFQPYVAVGAQYKTLGSTGLDGTLDALGAKRSGVDFYVSATKLFLGQGLLVNGTLRATKGNQNGLLGYGATLGGKENSYSVLPEFSVAYLLSKNVVVGAEYRFMRNKLAQAGAAAGLGNGLRSGDWKDVFIAWAPNKNVSLTLAYVDLGVIVPATTASRKQTGYYVSAQVAF